MRTRKFTKSQKPKEFFLVVCEGETEEQYIHLLRCHFHLPVTIKVKVARNAITSRLIDQYISEIKLGKNDKCSIFFIYDGDIPEMVTKLQKFAGQLILTTPCIEFWFILHHLSYRKSISSDDTIRTLKKSHSAWQNYSKASLSIEQKQQLIENLEMACSRCKSLPHHSNPSSDFPIFIQALKNAQKS